MSETDSREPQLRKVSHFHPEAEANQPLRSLEDNVQEALRGVVAGAAQALTPTSVIRSNYEAKTGELVLYAGADAPTITLPRVKPHMAGQWLVVKEATNNAGTCTIKTVDGAEIDASGAEWIKTAALDYVCLLCDGADWFVIWES